MLLFVFAGLGILVLENEVHLLRMSKYLRLDNFLD